MLQELIGSLKLGNVWVFVQLIFGPPLANESAEKNQTLHNLRLPIRSVYDPQPMIRNVSYLELHELLPRIRVLVLEEEASEDKQVPNG